METQIKEWYTSEGRRMKEKWLYPTEVDPPTAIARRLPAYSPRWEHRDFVGHQLQQDGMSSEATCYSLILELHSIAGSTGGRHYRIWKARNERLRLLPSVKREQLAAHYGRECDTQLNDVVLALRAACPFQLVLHRPARNKWCWTWDNYYDTAERFDDMQPKPAPDRRTDLAARPAPPNDHYVECPVCRTYGGWVLKDNVYAPYDTTQPPPSGWTWPTYAAFYGPRQHSRASCSQCNGWGWVLSSSASASCIHEVYELSQAQCRTEGITHHGMCWHVYRCLKCNYTYSEDSSD